MRRRCRSIWRRRGLRGVDKGHISVAERGVRADEMVALGHLRHKARVAVLREACLHRLDESEAALQAAMSVCRSACALAGMPVMGEVRAGANACAARGGPPLQQVAE